LEQETSALVSGGERERLALARAILRKLTVIIAHRTESLVRCDRLRATIRYK
jgi:ABC-type multidrug transport system fused ATPase/permease subunit